jgi:hypothetical protein
MTTQGAQITLEASTYPASRLFKPVKMDFVAQPVPMTREERAHPWGKQTSGSVNDDFNDSDLSAWQQVGIYWVRQTEGRHPQCHTNDRLGAHARWRNAPGSYCCDGFPYFLPDSIKRFQKEFELLKPILRVHLGAGRYLLLSMQRTIEGAIGTCWGMRTAETFWRLEIDDKISVFAPTKAALHRELSLHLPARLPKVSHAR